MWKQIKNIIYIACLFAGGIQLITLWVVSITDDKIDYSHWMLIILYLGTISISLGLVIILKKFK